MADEPKKEESPPQTNDDDDPPDSEVTFKRGADTSGSGKFRK